MKNKVIPYLLTKVDGGTGLWPVFFRYTGWKPVPPDSFFSPMTALLHQFLVLFSDLLPEIGVYFLDPLLRSRNLLVIDVSDLDVVEGPNAVRKLNRLFCIGTRRALDLDRKSVV